jgi:hypothetical protein
MPAANAPTEALLKASAAHNDAFERIGLGCRISSHPPRTRSELGNRVLTQ